ncbi:hypothetical protein [Rhodohalobacter sp. 8-1]|uniref:hypothetical protein n=1 Tax=Rhodohalobacter sp. 8-1 TaxID=3131972 RepID=UPI0030ED0929
MSSWFEKSYVYRKKIHPILTRLPFYDYWMLRRHSMLAEKGWFKSFRSGKSMDNSGKPIPWFVYSAVELLDERLPEDAIVFEYGSGSGTLWWAGRAANVHSVEHNPSWKEKMKSNIPENVQLLYRKLGEGYESSVLISGLVYDVVILDGRNRDKCLGHSLRALSERGVIIFDDSNWKKYHKTIGYLHSLGFRQMPFRGMCPIEFRESETSVFYRDGNLLGL